MIEPFVTVDYLKNFMGTTEVPANATTLIQRASDLIYVAMRNNYIPSNPRHVEVVKLATCSQVQDWIERSVSAVSSDNVASYSVGELSMTYANKDFVHNCINITACKYLNSECLLYKGLR